MARIPYLIPVTWSNGWPVLGTNGAALSTLTLDNPQTDGYGLVTSDDFDEEVLPLEWQWNHNPDNANWSLSANKEQSENHHVQDRQRSLLRKEHAHAKSFGPKCSGRIALDASGMKDGDFAGLAALQDSMAFVGFPNPGHRFPSSNIKGNRKGSVPVSQNKVYLRIDMDFTNQTDKATFYYSLDGTAWKSIGSTLSMSYTLGMFVGYRFSFQLCDEIRRRLRRFRLVQNRKGITTTKFSLPRRLWRRPYADTLALTPPGTVEAENYDVGGQGVSYSDNESANQGDVYRTDGVDIVRASREATRWVTPSMANGSNTP